MNDSLFLFSSLLAVSLASACAPIEPAPTSATPEPVSAASFRTEESTDFVRDDDGSAAAVRALTLVQAEGEVVLVGTLPARWVGVRIELYSAEGQQLSSAGLVSRDGEISRIPLRASYFHNIAYAMLRLGSHDGALSDAHRLDVSPQGTIADGAACDLSDVRARCSASSICNTTSGLCASAMPTASTAAEAWIAGSRLFVRVTGEENAAPVRLQWRTANAAGPLSDWIDRGYAFGLSSRPLEVDATLANAEQVTRFEWRFVAFVQHGVGPREPVEGEGHTVDVRPVAPGAYGVRCVPSEPESCAAGLSCIPNHEGEARCSTLPEACRAEVVSFAPPAFGDLAAPEAVGATTTFAMRSGVEGGCIVFCSTRNSISGSWRFIAPVAGTYAFSADGDFAVGDRCVGEAHLTRCGAAATSASLALTAGQTVYVQTVAGVGQLSITRTL